MMRLVVFHYHLRPGGVRRVIELALPGLVARRRPRIREVLLLVGEPPEAPWLAALRARLHPVPVEVACHPALGYLAELPPAQPRPTRQVRAALAACLGTAPGTRDLVWAHNLGLGRNLVVAREWIRACATRRIRLIAHHHDWWFDNRWQRWPELVRAGARTLDAVARSILAADAGIRHATINRADQAVLGPRFRARAGWIPNPASRGEPPPPARVRRTRRWLADPAIGAGPVWLLPCRLLRRKNIAEALLLTRWLRPEARLVTTGAISSPEEQNYARALAEAARSRGWPLHLSVLGNARPDLPSVAELLAASEVVLLTSLVEGFGLPYLEAAAAGRPLVARALPNVAPDLARLGFVFPQSYDEILVDPSLFDVARERRRQAHRFAEWQRHIPRSCRPWIGLPHLLAHRDQPGPVPFSRLTLTAQLEVLSHAPADSWSACSALNPRLVAWRKLARRKGLAVTPWPAGADHELGPEAYARRFFRLAASRPARPPAPAAAVDAQNALLRIKLAAPNLYPLLWGSRP